MRVYFVFDKMLNLLWNICYAVGQIFVDVNGQTLKTNLAIWSRWSQPFWPLFKHFTRLCFREKEEKEQQNLSLMLMFVVMVFMLCNVLAMVSNILEALKVRICLQMRFKLTKLGQVTNAISNLISNTDICWAKCWRGNIGDVTNGWQF